MIVIPRNFNINESFLFKEAGKPDKTVSEALKAETAFSDAVFAGLDHAHRQRGAGDSSISRKVRKSGEAFYGLARGLDQGFSDNTDKTMLAFIARNALAKGREQALVSYLRRADKALRQVDELDAVIWPDI